MLTQIYIMITLLIFLALIFMGHAIELAILKSMTVFIVLLIGTKVCIYLLDIIKENSHNDQESPSHN